MVAPRASWLPASRRVSLKVQGQLSCASSNSRSLSMLKTPAFKELNYNYKKGKCNRARGEERGNSARRDASKAFPSISWVDWRCLTRATLILTPREPEAKESGTGLILVPFFGFLCSLKATFTVRTSYGHESAKTLILDIPGPQDPPNLVLTQVVKSPQLHFGDHLLALLLRRRRNGMEWNGMEWNGMEWNGMEWNGNNYKAYKTCRIASAPPTHPPLSIAPLPLCLTVPEDAPPVRASVIGDKPSLSSLFHTSLHDIGASGGSRPLLLAQPLAVLGTSSKEENIEEGAHSEGLGEGRLSAAGTTERHPRALPGTPPPSTL